MINLPEDIHDLILGRLSDSLSPEENQKLQTWLEQSREHRDMWQDYCVMWYSGVIGEKSRSGQHEAAWQNILQKYKQRRSRRILRWSVSVAASCVLLLGSGWLFYSMEQEKPVIMELSDLVSAGQQEKAVLVLASGKQLVLDKKQLREEAGVSIQLDSTGITYQEQSDVKVPEQTVYNELIVPYGGDYRLFLSDGTKVILNAGSTLRFPVRFAEKNRDVWVTGEAYFQVTRNENQPFVVHTGDTEVRVLGTEFNVMAYKEETETAVTLVHGAVEVKAAGQAVVLTPGCQVVVNNVTHKMEERQVNVNDLSAWIHGVFRFDDVPLEQLMVRLGRWYNITFQFREESVKHRLFTGGCKKEDQIEKILGMIERVNDVVFKVEDNCVVIDRK